MSLKTFLLLDKPKHFAIAVGVLVLVLGSAYVFFIAEPKPASEKPEDLTKFIASQKFRKLPLERQKYYTSKLRDSSGGRQNFRQIRQSMEQLSPEERRTAFENMWKANEVQRNKEALEYVKMTREQRNAFLDKKIEEFDRHAAEMRKRFEQMRQQRQANPQPQRQRAAAPAQKNQNGGTPQQRPSRESRMKNRMENTPPEVRAAHQIMFREMMERRKETGKAMPHPPRR